MAFGAPLVRSSRHSAVSASWLERMTWQEDASATLPFPMVALSCLVSLLWLLPVVLVWKQHSQQTFLLAVFAAAAAAGWLQALPGTPSSQFVNFDAVASCYALCQAAMVVLGPEDALLMKRLATGGLSPVSGPLLLVTRALPCAALIASITLASQATATSAWAASLQVVNVCIALAFVACWLLPASWKGSRYQVAASSRWFWYRMFYHLGLPVAAGGLLIASACTSGVSDAALTISFRALAATLSAVALASLRESEHYPITEIEHVPGGPNCFRVHLLYGWLVVVLFMLAPALSIDAREHHGFRWPTLSMAETSTQGKMLMGLTSPQLAVAVLLVFQTIQDIASGPDSHAQSISEATPLLMQQAEPAQDAGASQDQKVRTVADADNHRATFRRWGCNLGQLSVLLGAMTSAAVEGNPIMDKIHSSLAVTFYTFLWTAILLTTLGSPCGATSKQGRVRAALTAMISLDLVALFVLFLTVNKYVPNTLEIPHAYYATAEYTSILLLGLWPLTWCDDVCKPGVSGRHLPVKDAVLKTKKASERAPTAEKAAVQ